MEHRVTAYEWPTDAAPEFKFRNDISPGDIVILVMGTIGSGKSNFINVLSNSTGSSVRATSSLRPSPLMIVTIRVPLGNGLVLVNTPGFLDSDDDKDRIDCICAWLEMINTAGIQLSGILYFFPLTWNMPRQPPLLSRMCDPDTLRNVILVTTMWNLVDFHTGQSREVAIQSKCSRLAEAGMTFLRFDNSSSAAWNIVNYFVHEDVVDTRMVFIPVKRVFTRINDKWELLKDHMSRNAIHKCGGCAKWPVNRGRTRAKIMDWVNGTTATLGVPILWLSGAAGVGKSTIARALAELLHSQNQLLATFFFSETDPTRNTTRSLVATIVYQIRNAVSPARALILNALNADFSVFKKSFEKQFSSLIAYPLAKLDHSIRFPRVVIIDGLDECVNQAMKYKMIRDIVKSLQKKPNFPLRILITSRPGPYLTSAFSEVPNSMVNHLVLENSYTRWHKFGEASASRAIHNSGERHDPPKCHPRTRVAIRNRLMNWITGKTAGDTRILWFYGPAGTGKSAIAQTLAETCESQNLLLASFFFSKTDPTRNAVNPLAVTVAYQMGTVVPDTQEMILSAVERNAGIFTTPFESQLTNLIIQPLLEYMNQVGISESQIPRIIIVDGLDECFDIGVQSQIVVSLSDALQNVDCPLRLVIVSRPEPHLEDVFNSRILTSLVYRLALDAWCIPDDDMRLFLWEKLAEIQKNPKHHSLPSNWPGSTAINYLVQRSFGQFVYASTIVQYISSSDDPCACLDKFIGFQRSHEDDRTPFAELDLLYLHILSSVKDIPTTKMILGVILFVEPDYDFFAPLNPVQSSAAQTLTGIENLLDLNSGKAVTYLRELNPLIQYSDDGHVFVSHATVAEFLSDPARSKAFHLDNAHIIATLIESCFRNIKNITGSNSASIRYAYGRIPQLCLRLPNTPSLRTKLMEFSLAWCYQWCQENAGNIGVGLTKPYLFPWWYVTRFLVMLRQLEEIEVYLVQLSAFDHLVHRSLERYPSDADLHFLLALTNIHMPISTNLTHERVVKFLKCLQIQKSTLNLDWSMDGLGLLSIYSEGRTDEDCFRVAQFPGLDIVVHTYHQFLFDFFSNQTRSGKYFLSPKAFACAALRCFEFVGRSANDPTDDDMDVTQIALFFIPHLLARASKSKELLNFIRSKGFKSLNLDGQEAFDAVRISITEYKRKYKHWFRLLEFSGEDASVRNVPPPPP